MRTVSPPELHAAFGHAGNIALARGPQDFLLRAAILHPGRARYRLQLADGGETRQDVVMHAVDQELVLFPQLRSLKGSTATDFSAVGERVPRRHSPPRSVPPPAPAAGIAPPLQAAAGPRRPTSGVARALPSVSVFGPLPGGTARATPGGASNRFTCSENRRDRTLRPARPRHTPERLRHARGRLARVVHDDGQQARRAVRPVERALGRDVFAPIAQENRPDRARRRGRKIRHGVSMDLAQCGHGARRQSRPRTRSTPLRYASSPPRPSARSRCPAAGGSRHFS